MGQLYKCGPLSLYMQYNKWAKFQNKGGGMKQTFEKPSHKKRKLA